MKARVPVDEPARLAALASFEILDTPPEQAFDDLALLAANICRAPIALVSLVDEQRQWFKSVIGLDVCETPRDVAFCAHAILQPDELLVVPDARLDPRFADNGLVTGAPHIRFYAGAPITTDGVAIGTLCVIDQVPRHLEEGQRSALLALARQASSQLELRRAVQIQRQLHRDTDRIAKSLSDSKERLQGIFDSSLDAIVSIDSNGLVTAFNAAAEQLFGCTAAQVLGEQMADIIIPPAHRAGHLAGMERFKRTGDARVVGRRIEISACRADGVEFPAELAISQVRTSRGSEFTAYIRDISRRKRAEEQLAAARDEAEAANRSKSEFLANMSHEIRTPLNGILGLSEIALDPDSDDDPKEMFELINGSAACLLDIVNSILDFSRIESTGVEVHPRPFHPKTVVGDVLRTLEPKARVKGLSFSYEQDEGVPPVLIGDAGIVRQIVFNLVGNSIKFTHSGFVRTSLEFDGMVAGQAAIRIVVSDSGIGIAGADMDRIFEAFAQTDSSDTRSYGGTGLGLAITRRLVGALHGDIKVSSTLGAGSTFAVSLLVDVAGADHVSESIAVAMEEMPRPDGQHVLILDDNATNRLIAGNWLRKHGYRTTEAETGMGALEAIGGDPPHLMLVDIQMPGMSGIEFLQRVRAGPDAISSVPAIALTAHALVGDRERFLGLGMEGYVAKPFGADTLLREVGRVLGLRPMTETIMLDDAPAGRFARVLSGLDNDEAMFRLLAAKAGQEFALSAARIGKYLGDEDWRQLQDLGHQVKGSWDLYARPGDEGMAAELMQLLAAGDHPAARPVATRLALALRQVGLDLDAWVRKHQASQ